VEEVGPAGPHRWREDLSTLDGQVWQPVWGSCWDSLDYFPQQVHVCTCQSEYYIARGLQGRSVCDIPVCTTWAPPQAWGPGTPFPFSVGEGWAHQGL
jgi:hypothetical protein